MWFGGGGGAVTASSHTGSRKSTNLPPPLQLRVSQSAKQKIKEQKRPSPPLQSRFMTNVSFDQVFVILLCGQNARSLREFIPFWAHFGLGVFGCGADPAHAHFRDDRTEHHTRTRPPHQ